MTELAITIHGFAAQMQTRKMQARTKLDLLKTAVILSLRAAGIATVEITFDGYGDSGSIEEINCLDSSNGVTDCPSAELTFSGEQDGNGPAPVQPTSLHEALESIGYLALELHHPGWENNEGATGSLEIDASKASFVLECQLRYVDYDEHQTGI